MRWWVAFPIAGLCLWFGYKAPEGLPSWAVLGYGFAAGIWFDQGIGDILLFRYLRHNRRQLGRIAKAQGKTLDTFLQEEGVASH